MTDRLSVREVRRDISKLLTAGKTVSIGQQYRELRGFLVGMPKHGDYDQKEKRAALKKARLAFIAAWMKEWER